MVNRILVSIGLCVWVALTACGPEASAATPVPLPTPLTPSVPTATAEATLSSTPLPTRSIIAAGQLLPYRVQSGDTVAALAAHFNTTPAEILQANPGLSAAGPLDADTRLAIPGYYFPLSGPAFKIIPDGALVYGPDSVGFDVAAYLKSQPGYARTLDAYMAGKQRDAAGAIVYIAEQFSINPRLLLAMLEWRTGALTRSEVPAEVVDNPFGPLPDATGFSAQLRWLAEQLSIGYYGWRTGTLVEIPLQDGYTSRVDSYQNAGTVGVQYVLGQIVPAADFDQAAGPDGFAATYRQLWGDPFLDTVDVFPVHFQQPDLALPFAPREQWSFTGGPHPGWGEQLPWSALDFAPPAGETGCISTEKWVTASAAGVIARSDDNTVILDLDGDGLEQTGWAIFYFHMAAAGLPAVGTRVQIGDPVGHPSCEGGHATGTHVHMARKYNGEWLLADGMLPFNLGGWTAVQGNAPYAGRMVRLGAWVEACTCSTASNRVYWVP